MKQLLAIVLCTAGVAAAQETNAWLLKIAQEQLAQRRAEVARLSTPEEIRQRGATIRKHLLRWVGGLPSERTPLNLRRTGVIERAEYRVEKIVFESQPAFYVTATLHVPKRGSGPFPAVLQPTGHSLAAKARGLYQSLAAGLAMNGFVVLTYDPLGQGERRIFFDQDLRDSKVGGTTVEHQMVGVQSLLAGESLARYMIWDGMRGIDVLQSLPYVDRERIGVSGCSGGGTLTAYIAALDDRVKVAAPSCYITSWEDQLQGTGPQDAEQQFPDQLRDGVDHGDLILAFAPRPYLIAATTEDFFPIEGARKTFTDMKRIYDRFGAEDSVALFVGPGGHGMRADTRGAVYAWMNRWLRNKPGQVTEPELTVELEEDLNATATGQVSTSLGGETASTLNIKRFASLRPPADNLPDRIQQATRFVYTAGAPAMQSVSVAERGGVRVERLRYEAEPGRFVPAALYLPEAHVRGTVLLLDRAGKASPVAAELSEAGYRVLTIDAALLGETASKTRSYADEWFPQDKTIWLALMTGRTVSGLRITDIRKGLDLLASRGALPSGGVTGFAIGNASVALLHAAAVDARIGKVVVEELPAPYRVLATTPIQRRIFDVVVPGVLKQYDLPDLAAAVAPRPVVVSNALSATGQILDKGTVSSWFRSGNVQVARRREADGYVQAYFPEERK